MQVPAHSESNNCTSPPTLDGYVLCIRGINLIGRRCRRDGEFVDLMIRFDTSLLLLRCCCCWRWVSLNTFALNSLKFLLNELPTRSMRNALSPQSRERARAALTVQKKVRKATRTRSLFVQKKSFCQTKDVSKRIWRLKN